MECVSSVCDDYKDRGLFPFTGTIETVTIDLSEAPQFNGHGAVRDGDEDGLMLEASNTVIRCM